MAEDSIKRLYVEKFDEWNLLLNKKRFSDRKLNVKVVNEGIVLPARKVKLGYAGGVCDKDFNRRRGQGELGFMLTLLIKFHAKNSLS